MFVPENLQFSEVFCPQLCLLLAKLGMCCLNFTGILSMQLLLLMGYPIQFLITGRGSIMEHNHWGSIMGHNYGIREIGMEDS